MLIKKGLNISTFHALQWREVYFQQAHSLSSKEAKQKAIDWATHLILFHYQKKEKALYESKKGLSRYDTHAVPLKLPGKQSLRHDTAEAILMGWWGLFQSEKIEQGTFREGFKS